MQTAELPSYRKMPLLTADRKGHNGYAYSGVTIAREYNGHLDTGDQAKRKTNGTYNAAIPFARLNIPLSNDDIIHQMSEAEFNIIYSENHKRVYALALRMSRSIELAEEITQNVFARVFFKYHTFRGDSKLSTWLHRLTVNEYLNNARKKNLPMEPIVIGEDDWGNELETQLSENPKQYSLVENRRIWESVEKLPPGYKNVFILYYYWGYEHEEIAKIIGRSVGNSKSQLFEAKGKMREYLGPDYPELYNAGERKSLSEQLSELAARKGKITVSDGIRHTGFRRSCVYSAFRRLRKKGMIKRCGDTEYALTHHGSKIYATKKQATEDHAAVTSVAQAKSTVGNPRKLDTPQAAYGPQIAAAVSRRVGSLNETTEAPKAEKPKAMAAHA